MWKSVHVTNSAARLLFSLYLLYPLGLLTGLWPVLARAESLDGCTEIGSIIIDALDIYPDDEEDDWFKYSS